MATKDQQQDESPYMKEGDPVRSGKPVGPEHDQSFSAPDFYDPKTGQRIGTDWDSEAQKNDPGIGEPGATEDAADQGKGGASGGEAGEHSTKRSDK